MFLAKLDELMCELGLAARLLRNFQGTQSGELYIEIAHLAGALANPTKEFEKFLLITRAIWNELFKQSLDSSRRGAKTVNRLGILVGRQLLEVALRFAE